LNKAIQIRLLALSGSMGFLMYGLGYSVPLVRRDLGVSRALASIHQLTFASLLIISSLYLTRVISRYNPTVVMRSGWVVVIIGVSFYAWGPNIWVTVPGYSFCAIGATLVNNTNSATLAQAPGSSLRMMLRITGIATGVGAFAPTLIGALVGRGISWRLTLLFFTIVIGSISFLLVPTVPDRSPIISKGVKSFDREFKLLIFLGFSANFLEVGAGAWALDLLIARDIKNAAALVLATVFSFGIAASRLGFSLRSRYGQARIWAVSTVTTALGLGLIIGTSDGGLTIVGLVIASIGVGPLGAIALAMASDSPRGSDIGIAANVIGAGFAIGIGPWLIGLASDQYGFSIAYAITALLLGIATIFFSILRKDRSSV
jgi:predicted MFS family arabinose efflux permease